MTLNKIINSDIYNSPFFKVKLEPSPKLKIEFKKIKEKNIKNKLFEEKCKLFEEYITEFDRSDWTEDKDKIMKPLYINLKFQLQKKYNAENVTIAWIKLYEILFQFNLINNNDNIFFICEAPGGFVFSLNHYCKSNNIKYNWYAQTLNPNQKDNRELFIDEFGLIKNYSKKYDFGINNTGDILSINNIKYYHKKYQNKINLVISDCGLSCSKDFRNQEKKLCKLFLSQIIITLGILKKKGNYIFKMFCFQNYNTQNFILLINSLFNETYICKPRTSKKFSNEIYIVAKNYKGIDKKDLELLIDYLKNYDDNISILNINQNFKNQLEKISEKLSLNIINHINFNNLLTDNWDIIDNNFITKLNQKYKKIDNDFLNYYHLKKIKNNQHLITKK